MKLTGIFFEQFELKMMLLSMSVDFLVEHSEVAVYTENKNENGYQRPLNPTHYKRISKYLTSEPNPILPTTILAATENYSIIKDYSDDNLKTISLESKFRLVDGQHRVEAFRYLKRTSKSDYDTLKDIKIPVTLLMIESEQKIYEVRTFVDINKKGKKVSTDLAIMLKDKIQKEQIKNNNKFNEINDMIDFVATKVTLRLEEEEDSVWFHAITKSPLDRNRIVSINTFNRTIKPIIKKEIMERNNGENLDENMAILIITSLKQEIDGYWTTIAKKWPQCFMSEEKKFSKEYIIQKTLGVEMLHKFFNQNDNAVQIIQKSNLKVEDWESGEKGKFAGLSSGSGISKALEILNNSIEYN